MQYGYKKQLTLPFQEAVESVRSELAKEGFGVLTEINVKATMRSKLGIDYDNYLILGACNPEFAHQAFQEEKEIGLLLPCNVIVYEDNGIVYASAVRPTVAMNMIENEKLSKIAKDVETKLHTVIDSL